jgi:hypothetical protein
MNDIKIIRDAIEDSFFNLQQKLRRNYTLLQDYCSKNCSCGSYLDWIADRIDLFSDNKESIRQLVSMETLKSASRRNEVNPLVESATNLLRKKLIDPKINSDYDKGENRAAFELLRQIRDNLTVFGKFDSEGVNAEMIFKIVRIGVKLSDFIVAKIKALNDGKV